MDETLERQEKDTTDKVYHIYLSFPKEKQRPWNSETSREAIWIFQDGGKIVEQDKISVQPPCRKNPSFTYEWKMFWPV